MLVGAVELLSNGACMALAVLMSLAVAEKVTSIRSGAAAWHPVMLMSAQRRRHARTLMTIAAAADATVVALLVLLPTLGGVLAIALLVLYTRLGAAAHGDGRREPCRCFWRVLNTATVDGLRARNATLAVLAALTATTATATWNVGSVALAAACLACVALAGTLGDRYAGRLSRTRVPPSPASTGP